jgi:hypothetical protein
MDEVENYTDTINGSSDFDLIIIVLLGVLALSVFMFLKTIRKRKNTDKITDDEVTVNLVLAHLKKYKQKVHENRKFGFTEKDVHNDLEVYLKQIFYSVTREYGIEGKNAKMIDFDIGNGKVGIEVKIAESALKEGEGDRLLGQMQKYIRRKYKDGNFILAVAGFENHTTNTVLHEIEEDVEGNGGHFIFLFADN